MVVIVIERGGGRGLGRGGQALKRERAGLEEGRLVCLDDDATNTPRRQLDSGRVFVDRYVEEGVWADVDGEAIFMAAKIRKDNEYAFKVRLTSDGTPFWTLSPERLAEEKAAVE